VSLKNKKLLSRHPVYLKLHLTSRIQDFPEPSQTWLGEGMLWFLQWPAPNLALTNKSALLLDVELNLYNLL